MAPWRFGRKCLLSSDIFPLLDCSPGVRKLVPSLAPLHDAARTLGVWFARAGFGLVNAIAILMSAALIATGLKVAGAVSLAPSGDQLATTQLLFEASSRIWDIAALFFGLWLIPMGSVVITRASCPRHWA